MVTNMRKYLLIFIPLMGKFNILQGFNINKML